MELALQIMGVCAFSEFFELQLTLQPKGHVTCKLLTHYFLECRDGGAFTCEIKLPPIERFHSFPTGPSPHPLDLSSSTYCTSTHSDSHETGSCQLANLLQVLSFGLPWALYIGFIVCVR